METGKTAGPFYAQEAMPLEPFLSNLEIAPKEQADDNWLTDTIAQETRAAIKRSETAKTELVKLRQETLAGKISKLKKTRTEPPYSDEFDRLVCTKLDELRPAISTLSEATSTIQKEIDRDINRTDLENYLTKRISLQKKAQLGKLWQKAEEKLPDANSARKFVALKFEIDERSTDLPINEQKFEQVLQRALGGETIDFISVLCTVNEFDDQGKYTLRPDIDAYLTNPKLEPVPQIIDEMINITDLFDYYGAANRLTVYVADTDYTEIGQCGPLTKENLDNMNLYIKNLRTYAESKKNTVRIDPVSELTDENQSYQETKTRVLDLVTKMRDSDFCDRWSAKFERAFEMVSEGQEKRKLYPPEIRREMSKTITRNAWAVNAGQGAALGEIGRNTVLLSTETRNRDQNYMIDTEASKKFPPTLYVLKTSTG